jgi:NitT/TauT family transport system permease protein
LNTEVDQESKMSEVDKTSNAPVERETRAEVRAPRKRSKLEKAISSKSFWRGVVALIGFVLLWEVCSRMEQWTGVEVPWIGKVPPPTEVLEAWTEIFWFAGYWESWYLSTGRVFAGFIAAMVLGIPFGLCLAVNRYFHDIFFPPFEVLRPIPPLAWVPASIVFWPTTELSIAFVTFLGAFFTIVINVLGGAKSIDIRFLRAAQSMGATQWDLFRKIILPGTLPSIFTGAAVGMGITWEVVLAGEMISGGGQQGGGGLGFFIWSSYMGGTVAQVIVGMISIGIAGYLSSSLIRYIGSISMPWRRLF